MELKEAKEVLEKNGFIAEDYVVHSNNSVTDRLNQIKKEINKYLLIRFTLL